jgi:hypothetical protein
MSSSPDKFCDGRTDRQTDRRTDRQTDGQTDDGEVIPICRQYSVEATQKVTQNEKRLNAFDSNWAKKSINI